MTRGDSEAYCECATEVITSTYDYVEFSKTDSEISDSEVTAAVAEECKNESDA